MAGKKGITPAHITKKQFIHPGIEHPIIKSLGEVDDPRKPSLFLRHSLTSMLFMTIVAITCGATDWPKVVIISEGLVDWLARYVDISSGIPCERTFKNVMNILNPETLEKILRDTSSKVREKVSQEVISFDGQTSRGTADKHMNVNGLHLVSAWSSDNGICLGQIKVDDKSNEITAVPVLMDSLDLKGTIVTADALNTQKAIATKAIDQGADYLLPVKGNQSTLLQEITLAFEGVASEQIIARQQWEHAIAKAKEHRDESRLQKLLTSGPSTCGAFFWQDSPEKSHGRIEIRSCTTIPVGSLPAKDNWENIASLVRIDRERTLREKTTRETIFYISSLNPSEPALIGEAAREHWGVENGLHWRLDVVFRQDKSRYRNRVGARNLAVVRKIVLNALSKETSIKGGMATKQCAASCNPSYRDKVVKNLF